MSILDRSREQQSRSLLLPFQRSLLSQLIPSEEDEHLSGNALLILARGLGLRSIVSTLLKVYQSPDRLVLVVNATPEEERGLSEEVGMRLKVVGYEMAIATRQDLYKSGGLLSVTSRILVVDMLLQKIPVGLVAGLVILHAERVTPTSQEAFIIRIFRNMNKTGFIKAFSDSPESFSHTFAPLQTILTQLKIREVIIVPRFQEDVMRDLVKRKADVIELYQPMSEKMKDIQTAIIECMEATLSEIKKSNTYLEVEELTVENALFKSFDALVRVQLDPVWHKVGPRTKGLVYDLTQLRKLQAFLETELSAQSTTSTGQDNKNKSPWLFTPAADTIFRLAKERVYRKIASIAPVAGKEKGEGEGPMDEDVEAMLAEQFEADEEALRAADDFSLTEEEKLEKERKKHEDKQRRDEEKRREKEMSWLPKDVEPVLEEQPKWELLKDVLAEIEELIHWTPPEDYGLSNETILIMTSTSQTCSTIREFLSTDSTQEMMLSRLRSYLYWKSTLSKMTKNFRHGYPKRERMPTALKAGEVVRTAEGGFESRAMKAKREWKRGEQPGNKRRRVRGGATNTNASPRGGEKEVERVAGEDGKLYEKASGADAVALEKESDAVADLLEATQASGDLPSYMKETEPTEPEPFNELTFNEYFGLLANEDLVIVRPYSGDEDDRVLEELKPKYIVLFDPDPTFVRRIETYRAAHAGLAVRVYFLMYKDSVEEQRYLSTIRKEKDAFERLIKERGSMALTHEAEYRPEEEQEAATLRAVSTRIGGRAAKLDPPKVIVDVREFRSSLPSLLHAGRFEVVPATLTVGDYVITPEMCVERKSLPDLISSFNSGRLYQQCEQMTAHYQIPILLIEFDEKKAFNLEVHVEAQSRGQKPPSSTTLEPSPEFDLRSKLVLLTLTFPRLRIIWSSSPYSTVDIFQDLKDNREEPDLDKAISIGAEEVPIEGLSETGLGFAAQELLRSMPGISSANYRYVMSKVESVEALCELSKEELHALIGVEKGMVLHRFIHRDVTTAVELLQA